MARQENCHCYNPQSRNNLKQHDVNQTDFFLFYPISFCSLYRPLIHLCLMGAHTVFCRMEIYLIHDPSINLL